jgi:hypothetical protein
MWKIIIMIAIALGIAISIALPRLALSENDPIAQPMVVDIQKVIELTFPDAPIMLEVGKAESWNYKLNNFNPKATNQNSTAKGVFQILDGTWKYWGCTGDPFQALDNIMCARKGYDKEGTTPWNASKGTWGKYLSTTK